MTSRLVHQIADRASQRCEADASGHYDNVRVVEFVDAPVGAERAADADVDPTSAEQSEWVTAPTSRTVCSTGPGASGALAIEIATSPTPNDAQHVELPRPERKRARARRWLDKQGRHVAGFDAPVHYPVGHRSERVRQRSGLSERHRVRRHQAAGSVLLEADQASPKRCAS